MTLNPFDINPHAVKKPLNESKTVDSLVPDGDLRIWAPAGNYHFDINVKVEPGTPIQCGIGTVVNSVVDHAQALKQDVNTGLLTHEFVTVNSGTGVLDIDVGPFRFWGRIAVLQDGTVNFNWARNTNFGTSTILAGSYFELRRVS